MAPTPADRRRQLALDELIEEDVSELIAEAREEARGRVRAQLADAFTEAMLARADRVIGRGAEADANPNPNPGPGPAPAPVRQVERPSPRDAEPCQDTESGPSGSGVYVYCVVRADTDLPGGLPSIQADHSPTLIRYDQLAAVVSEVPLADFGEDRLRERLADMDWLERTARAHELALETVGRLATLIPMRLCSVYQSENGVREMLAREAEALEEALVHLEGKSEWGVKVFASLPPVRPRTANEPGDSGADYMQRRRADRDRRRNGDQQLHDACVAIHERLAAIVAEALTSPPQRPEVSGHPGQMVLNGVYLVEDEQRVSFLTLVDELKIRYREDGLELHATGPWPAYNFVPGTIGAAW